MSQSSLENQPLIESIAVDLPAPSLNDNTADLDRLARTLGQLGYSPVQIAPGKMDELVRKMRGNDLCFRAVVGYTGTHWEVLDVVARSPDSAVFGFALDLGTSSLVFRLIDIARKKIIREVSVEKSPGGLGGRYPQPHHICPRSRRLGSSFGTRWWKPVRMRCSKCSKIQGPLLIASTLYPAQETRR